MPATVQTPDELRDLLVTIIVGATGVTDARWCKAIGKLSLASNVSWTWRLSSSPRSG